MTLEHETKEGTGSQGESKETRIETDAPVQVQPEDTQVAEQASDGGAGDGGGEQGGAEQ